MNHARGADVPLALKSSTMENNYRGLRKLSLLVFFIPTVTLSLITLQQSYFMAQVVIMLSLGAFVLSLIFYFISSLLLKQENWRITGWICFALYGIINLINISMHIVEAATPHPWAFG